MSRFSPRRAPRPTAAPLRGVPTFARRALLARVLSLPLRLRGGFMAGPTRVSLEELLLRHGAITDEQLQRAKEEQRMLGGDLGRTLVHLGFITDELLMRAWAHQTGTRPVAPDKMALGEDLLHSLSVQLCETFGIIGVGRDPRTSALLVATNDPGNAEHLSAIGKAVGENVLPVAATSASIERAIRRHTTANPRSPSPTPVRRTRTHR